MSWSAMPFPTSRGRRCVPPPPGMIPTLTSGWPELRVFGSEPDGARHRGFASTAERKAVDGRDYRLTKILDQVECRLCAPGVGRRTDRGDRRHFGEVRPCDERF